MASAKIYYYPDPDGPVVTIDLLTNLSDLEEIPEDVVDVAESTHGDQSRQLWRSRLRVRALLERFSGSSSAGQGLARDLLSLRHHLMRGGSIGLTADSSKAWCAWSVGVMASAGATIISTRGDPTSGWAGGTVASGDELVVFGGQPAPPYEWTTCSSLSGAKLTLATGLRYSYDTRVGIRHRNYFPALILPADQAGAALLTHERRTNYTLDLELVEDIAALDAMSHLGAGELRGTTYQQGQRSIDAAVAREKGAPARWSK